MADERTIPTSRPSDLPTFKIFSEGKQLSAEYNVVSVIVSKSVNRIPFAKVILSDGFPSSEDFPVSNLDFFEPGKNIEIYAGYHNDNELIFNGIVIKHALKARDIKPSFLIVECKDHSVKMSVGRKNKFFTEITDGEIMEDLIGKYGLGKNVAATKVKHKEMVQYYCTDWDFMVSRAEVNGLLVIADDGKINIEKPTVESKEVLSLIYGATIIDFEAEMDARNQYPGIKASSWDYSSQELYESESSKSSIKEAGNFSESKLADVIGLKELEFRHGGNIPENELQQWADTAALKSSLSKIRGRVKCFGFPKIKPGNTLKLSGVGERFNGNVFVAGVDHQISDNTWYTEIYFGLSPEWFSSTNNINDNPASGLVAAINGLQVGVVTQLQDDPNGEDRILVQLPVADIKSEGIWSRVCTLDAGNNRGSFFRPEIGDEVIVGFINDDPRNAIVLGMLNSSTKPAPIKASDENHEKGFVTRSEMKLTFDDDKVSVTIETPNGNKMLLSDADGGIKIEDENGNYLEFNSGGITIESTSEIRIKSSADTNIESGTNMTAKAGAQFSAEGNAGAKLSTGAAAIIQGSVVQIN